MEGKVCPHCKIPVSDLKGFCPNCGKRLSDEVQLSEEATIEGGVEPALIAKALMEKPDLEKLLGVKREKEVEEVPPEYLEEEPSQDTTAIVEEIARYGPPPARWFESVPYTIRVFHRKRALKADIKRISDVCTRKRNECDSELLLFGHMKTKMDNVRHQYPGEVAEIEKARANLEAAQEEKSSEEREFEEKEAYLNLEMSRLQEEKSSLERERQSLGGERGQLSMEMKHANAKIKKAAIGMEKVQKLLGEIARRGAPDLALTEKYKFQIREIEGEKTREEEKAKKAQDSLTEIDRKLHLVANKLKDTQAKIGQADQRKSQVVASLKERSKEVAMKFHQLHNEYDKCIRDLAMASFNKGDIAERKQELISKIKAAEEADRMLEKYLMALDYYDGRTYKRGMALLAGGGGVVLLLVAGVVTMAIIVLISLLW